MKNGFILIGNSSLIGPQRSQMTRLVMSSYTDPNGVERTWESAERQVRNYFPPYNFLPDGISAGGLQSKHSFFWG